MIKSKPTKICMIEDVLYFTKIMGEVEAIDNILDTIEEDINCMNDDTFEDDYLDDLFSIRERLEEFLKSMGDNYKEIYREIRKDLGEVIDE